jgi:hypothetical protein
MGSKAIVLVHYEAGDPIPVYYIVGDDVQVFVVDENAPGDRVYEMTDRDTIDSIQRLIPEGSIIGSSNDERHAALENRILAHQDGRPLLAIVPSEPA